VHLYLKAHQNAFSGPSKSALAAEPIQSARVLAGLEEGTEGMTFYRKGRMEG